MGVGIIDTQAMRQRWESVGSKLDERGRRVFAAGEVRSAGWGGLEAVSKESRRSESHHHMAPRRNPIHLL